MNATNNQKYVLGIIFAFAMVFTLGLNCVSQAKAGDYNLSLSPAPNATVYESSAYSFDSSTHPQITITATGPTNKDYTSYYLYIMNSGTEYKKHGGTASEVFGSPYVWDLCTGNQDFTNGSITVTLRGEGLAGLAGTVNDLASTSFIISSYKGGCSASDSENAPSAGDLWISSVNGSNASNVIITVKGTNLDQYLNTVSGSTNEFHLVVDDVDKTKKYTMSGDVMTFSWDSTGTATGTHTVSVQFFMPSSGSVVSGGAVYVTKNSDGTVTTDSSNSAPDGSDSSNISNLSSSSLIPISFSVPDLSTLKGKTGSEIIVWVAKTVIDLIIIIASLLAGIAFIFSGIQYGLSLGDAAKAEKAKKNLMWASIGVAIMIGAITILSIASRIINYVG